MSGRASTTVSPSSSRTTRRTPWVLGCWGPRLRLRVSALMTSARALQGKVLSQGVPLEVLRQQDPSEIGVVAEPDAEQIEALPLVPVGRLPDGHDGVDDRVLSPEGDLDPETVAVPQRKEVVDHQEAGARGVPVNAAQIGQEIEGEALFIAEKCAERRRCDVTVDRKARLPPEDGHLADGCAEAFTDRVEVHRAPPCASRAIFSWSRMRPSSSASGLTGQPGM